MLPCYTKVEINHSPVLLQIDQQKLELEKVDHQMGKKRTELQFLTENLERKQGEINQLIRDTESELGSNKREIKVSYISHV